jgi:ATP-binding cassette, subfamily B, bacterial
MMSQFPAFFHDTLRENLRIAKPDATDEELISICRTTGMLDILEAKGLTHDSNLAGGQILLAGLRRRRPRLEPRQGLSLFRTRG